MQSGEDGGAKEEWLTRQNLALLRPSGVPTWAYGRYGASLGARKTRKSCFRGQDDRKEKSNPALEAEWTRR